MLGRGGQERLSEEAPAEDPREDRPGSEGSLRKGPLVRTSWAGLLWPAGDGALAEAREVGRAT